MNYNTAFIEGSSNLHISAVKDHIHSDMHARAMALFSKSQLLNMLLIPVVDRVPLLSSFMARMCGGPLLPIGHTVGSGSFQSLFTGMQVCYSDSPSFAGVVGASHSRKSKALQMEFNVAAV